MIGFQAIAVPDSAVRVGPELEAAGWFSRDDIESGGTLVPPSHSISYQLISAWLKGTRD
jgi:NADH pyrophosphatase NudC (nudix superfamily)